MRQSIRANEVNSLIYIIFLLVTACAGANDSDTIKINNQLSTCISVTNTAISKEGAIPVFSFDLEVHKPIAECGCKSALGSYTVYSSTKGYNSHIIGGKVGILASVRKRLPLSAERNLIRNKELILRFSCAQPD